MFSETSSTEDHHYNFGNVEHSRRTNVPLTSSKGPILNVSASTISTFLGNIKRCCNLYARTIQSYNSIQVIYEVEWILTMTTEGISSDFQWLRVRFDLPLANEWLC